MAKNFKTLIRIRKWALDEKRRELSDMQAALDHLVAEKAELERAVIAEQKVAATDPELAGFAYGNFASAVIAEREVLTKRIHDQERAIESFRDVVADAFKELKTIEISERNRIDAEQAEENRKEQNDLDEIGARSATRKDDGI
ncbi:flagellar FliJ family protein [Thalassospira sp.]|uniref:flagellar FliJ family protein n=1 Tax=Thalassospira sp. TaxID=1912094 RepID=UPI002732EDEF|nr:flagellar FliJ family protein [Thalassospira sp.]MDP2696627.1 flagellar FliJ family protein [Thalassospira sp.]